MLRVSSIRFTVNLAIFLSLLFGFRSAYIQAQEKVDGNRYPWHELATGFSHACYTMKFTGAAAAARGGEGVSFLEGAKAMSINPANIFTHNRWEIYYDNIVNRNEVSVSPSFVFERQQRIVGSLEQVFRVGEKFVAGVGISNIRRQENLLEIHETTYEYPYGSGRTATFESSLDIMQYSAALAFRWRSDLRVGLAAHLLNYGVAQTNNEFHNVYVKDEKLLLVFQLGITKKINDLRVAFTIKSPEDIGLVEDGGFVSYGEQSVKVPAEVAAGVDYRDLISAEIKYYFISQDYYPDQQLYQVGGGLHVPLAEELWGAAVRANAGIIHRVNPEFNFLNSDQTFLTIGGEIESQVVGVYLTWLNGHLLNDEAFRVSEVLFGLKYGIR